MPGLTNNETILSSDNQLILTQNEQTTALNSIKSAIDDITEQLAAIKSQMATCCNGGADLEGVSITDLTPLQADKKCKNVNYVFDVIYSVFIELEAQDVDQYGSVGMALSAGVVSGIVAAAVTSISGVGAILVGVVTTAVVFLITVSADINDIIRELENNRSAIISDMYVAESIEALSNAFLANMTLQNPERALVAIFLTADLLKFCYVDKFEVPAGYTPITPCGDSPLVGCVNPNDRTLNTYWGLGTSLLVNGNFISGNSTGAWDYVVYHIVFGCMGDPIPTFTINSITTPSIDYLVETCDGTEYQVNECLAAQFPKTFYDVVFVSLTRTASNFTVSLTFA